MQNKKKICVREDTGEEWPSIAEAARANGYAISSFRYHVDHGIPHNGIMYTSRESDEYGTSGQKTWICEDCAVRFRGASSECPICGLECFAAIDNSLWRFLPYWKKNEHGRGTVKTHLLKNTN